jgi:hypothetical protein
MRRADGVINRSSFRRNQAARKKAQEEHREKIVEKEKLGRPSLYKGEQTDNQIHRLALLGLKDRELADIIGVSEETFNLWKLDHPSMLQSLNNGKAEADGKVAFSLYQRALGYDHPEDDIRIFKDKETGKLDTIITPIVKHYPPDVTACIFWLKNRQRETWRDVHKTEVTGPNGKPILHDHRHLILDLTTLSDQELQMAESIGLEIQKQITEKSGE